MEKITYILPLHKFDDEVKKFTKIALESLNNLNENDEDRLIVVGPKNVVDSANELYKEINGKLPITIVENDDKTDYFSQVNLAVSRCVTPYFSIIEFDDCYKPYWKKTALKYLTEDISILIPIYEIINNGKFDSFANEISWSASFSENEQSTLGHITEKELSIFMDFFLDGSIIKTEDFLAIGGFKPSLKIAAQYEFLLRADYKGKGIFVVPKIGYSHTVGRADSFSEVSYGEISKEEGKWLIDTARQEYFFKEDRNKTFKNNEEENSNEG